MKYTKSALVILAAFVIAALFLAGCDMPPTPPSADQVQRQQQEAMSQQSNMVAGMPAIANFAEKKMMKEVLELRDKMVPTYTYSMDINGKVHFVCNSIGLGLPGATQYTNPQRIAKYTNGGTSLAILTLPQADPNGLFMPSSDSGTYIKCVSPVTKEVGLVRFEPNMVFSTVPLI